MDKITDEQIRSVAAELILAGKTIEQAELPDELATAVRKLAADLFGLKVPDKQKLSPEQQAELLKVLENRFKQKPDHYERPKGVNFTEIKTALEARPDLMYSLAQMEKSGGAVDVRAVTDSEFVFCDFIKETPEDRRGLSYHQVEKAAKEMGVDIQSEEGWCALQKLGAFDANLWIWVKSDEGGVRIAGPGGVYFGVDRGDAVNRFPDGGWRAELRVPKA